MKMYDGAFSLKLGSAHFLTIVGGLGDLAGRKSRPLEGGGDGMVLPFIFFRKACTFLKLKGLVLNQFKP